MNKDFWEKYNKRVNKSLNSDKCKELNLSEDKLDFLKKSESIFRNNNMISIVGSNGSGKTLLINTFFDLLKEDNNKKIIIINLDAWKMFGLRNAKDYKNEMPTASAEFVNGNKIIYSYTKNEESTKLNTRKIIWRSLADGIFQNSTLWKRFKFFWKKFTYYILGKNSDLFFIHKMMLKNGRKEVGFTKSWFLLIVICFLLLIGVSIWLIFFNQQQVDKIVGLTTLITSIMSSSLIIVKKAPFGKKITINDFLIDENNHYKIRDFIKIYTKGKLVFVQLENLDRLKSWLDDFNNAHSSSLVKDILICISLMYGEKHTYLIFEINKNIVEYLEETKGKKTDYSAKLIGQKYNIKAIDKTNSLKRVAAKIKGRDIEIVQLISDLFHDVYLTTNSNLLSYRLINDYVNLILDFFDQRVELKNITQDLFEEQTYKNIIKDYLIAKRKFSSSDFGDYSVNFNWQQDTENKINPKDLNTIFLWFQGKCSALKENLTNMINFNIALPKIDFIKGFSTRDWLNNKMFLNLFEATSNQDQENIWDTKLEEIMLKAVKIDASNINSTLFSLLSEPNVDKKVKMYFASSLDDKSRAKSLISEIEYQENDIKFVKENKAIITFNKASFHFVIDHSIKIEREWIESVSSLKEMKYMDKHKMILNENEIQEVYEDFKNTPKPEFYPKKNWEKWKKCLIKNQKTESPAIKRKITIYFKNANKK